MTIDVLGTLRITFPNGTHSPLRGGEVRAYGEAGLENLVAGGQPLEEVTAARHFDLKNPNDLRRLADYIESNRW